MLSIGSALTYANAQVVINLLRVSLGPTGSSIAVPLTLCLGAVCSPSLSLSSLFAYQRYVGNRPFDYYHQSANGHNCSTRRGERDGERRNQLIQSKEKCSVERRVLLNGEGASKLQLFLSLSLP